MSLFIRDRFGGMVKTLFLGSALAVLSACSDDKLKSDKLVFDGYFEMNLGKGHYSLKGSDCISNTSFQNSDHELEIDKLVCVVFPAPSDPDDLYLNQLMQQKWGNFGGAANVYWVDRPKENGCLDKLYMVGLPRGDLSEVRKWGTSDEGSMDWNKIPEGMFLFSVEEICEE